MSAIAALPPGDPAACGPHRAVPLAGMRVAAAGDDPAAAYAVRLLRLLGAEATEPGAADVVLDATGRTDAAAPPHPEDDWAASGAMALTGRADGPPLRAPGAPATAIRGALMACSALARVAGGGGDGAVAALERLGPAVLAERAALAGFARRGPLSAGGAFRLLRTADGWLGASLARPADVELLPALIEAPPGSDPWADLAAWARTVAARRAAERAAMLGLPIAAVGRPRDRGDEQLTARGQASGAVRPFLLRRLGPAVAGAGARARTARAGRPPLVADLSALWAGPLCGHVLGLAGARVVKVESTRRPDGARHGPQAFYDLLHAGHDAVALDFTAPDGRAALRALLERADVVIEASRPRALAQLGIDPDAVGTANPGLTWVSITAYGRCGPWAQRVGFGDDVAAAAGLVARDADGPLPCGDAIADPLAGVHAAVAALAGVIGGGGVLADVAMREVALAARTLPAPSGALPPRRGLPAAPPAARHPAGTAHGIGADTARVLAELGIPAPASLWSASGTAAVPP